MGEKITMLVLFHNKGKAEFNITAIRAHLHSPFDYSYYIQNVRLCSFRWLFCVLLLTLTPSGL